VRILVIGSGGREHAIVRRLSQDSGNDLHAAPGNPGIGALAELHPDPAEITALAAKLSPDLVVIGPEAPLVAGAASELHASGFTVFGPTREAAMLEGSKTFAKQVMREARIPTANATTCTSRGEAERALTSYSPPYVVKNDGLAAGKGVLVTENYGEALAHAESCGTVVIEEFLDGPEVSLFAVSDGRAALPLLPAQDFKRAHDGDQGPNTGGMGAYCPLPWAPADLVAETMERVVQPAIDAMRLRGTPYRGLLYAGLALTSKGLRVVEFNARFGDPETQVVLDLLSSSLAPVLFAAASGDLGGAELSWRDGAAVTVVIAAEGYPEAPVRGDIVRLGADSPDAYVLHAGTSTRAGALVSAGGRVLNVVGTGPDVAAARAAAYRRAAAVEMRGGWYRRDIAGHA